MFAFNLEVVLVLIKLYFFQGGQVLLYKQVFRSTCFGWRISHGYPNYILSKGPSWMYGRGRSNTTKTQVHKTVHNFVPSWLLKHPLYRVFLNSVHKLHSIVPWIKINQKYRKYRILYRLPVYKF